MSPTGLQPFLASQVGVCDSNLINGDSFLTGLSDQIPDDSNSISMMSQLSPSLASARTKIVHNIDEDQNKGLWQVIEIEILVKGKYFGFRELPGPETSNLFGVKPSCWINMNEEKENTLQEN